MNTNKFIGLVGTAALFAAFGIACAAPAVQRSSGDGSGEDTSAKNDTAPSTPSKTTTTPPSTSTATTTAATVTDAGTKTTPVATVDWCGKLSTCADNASVDPTISAGFLITALIGNETACQVAYVTCKTNIFQSNCDKLSDCCDEMNDNGNAALSNACRSKANARNNDTCSTQLDSYEGDGRCN